MDLWQEGGEGGGHGGLVAYVTLHHEGMQMVLALTGQDLDLAVLPRVLAGLKGLMGCEKRDTGINASQHMHRDVSRCAALRSCWLAGAAKHWCNGGSL